MARVGYRFPRSLQDAPLARSLTEALHDRAERVAQDAEVMARVARAAAQREALAS